MKKIKIAIITTMLLIFLMNFLAPISYAVSNNIEYNDKDKVANEMEITENKSKENSYIQNEHNEEKNYENKHNEDVYENDVQLKNEEKVDANYKNDIVEKKQEPVKSILNIDTNLNNTNFNKNLIHIEGWKLATEADTELHVYIDNKKIDDSYIKYSYKYDLISIVKGYGTYKENPKPNFDIDIPTNNIKQGSHNIRIEFILQDGTILEKIQNTIYIDKDVKSILNIDTNLNNAKFDKNGINIEGWKLATESDTELQVYIDNKKIDDSYIKYSYKYDLISIVKGYGTYKENPTPNFDINIPIDNITQGNHTIIIKLITTNGTVLKNVQNNIYVDKSIKSLLNIDTNLNNAKFDKYGIHIEGWKLADVADTKLNIYIDNKKIDEKYIKYAYKYNLTSIVKGYGEAKENPKPNFDIDIPVNDITNGVHKLKIEFVTSGGDILQKVENSIHIDKSVKSILNIDTVLDGQTFGREGIHIEGWKLATEPNTKLNVYLNNKKIDEKYIKYSYKYNLTSIVKGYGNAEENPKPNFDIDIPKEIVDDGTYILKIEFTNSDGSVILKNVQSTIYMKKEYKGIDVSQFQRNYQLECC